jgi:pSer/pThr/pTyr-binding forkhead associated (FHA) protein
MDALAIGTGSNSYLIPLTRQRLSIGRADENDVVLSGDGTASRRHAVLERVDDGWRIRDLGSSNGTYVNGVRVGSHMRVRPGDQITIGESALGLREGESAPDPVMATVRPSAAEQTGPILSQRERAVLRLLATGMTDTEIAEQLTISVKTVHSHLDRIRDRSGLRRRAELTRLAVELGLTGE